MKAAEVLAAAIAAEGEAREILLDHARTLDLRERIIGCTSCPLSSSTTPVPWEGRSSIAIIGEAPGAEEARSGRPFVGQAGRLLDSLLALAGFKRSDIAFVNTISCRPPNNDYSKATDVNAHIRCTPNFWEQVAHTGAWLLVPVGNVAMWKLLPEITAGITQMRGQLRWRDRHLIMPTFHPAYALRTPSAKDAILNDLMTIKRIRTGVEPAPVPASYDPTRLLSSMRDRDFTQTEATPMKTSFKKKGWVFAYSTWLEEMIILVRDDTVTVPTDIKGVVYTVQELAQLAAMKSRTWEDARRLHYAKREFDARII